MSGFPTREARGAFGPTRQDSEPAPDETYALSAAFLNLLMWQVAGLALSAPKAWFVYNGATNTMLASGGQAWNAGGANSPPSPTKSATGTYVFTFPSTVADQDGVSVSPGLSGAMVTPQQLPSAGMGVGQAYVSGGNTINVRTYDVVAGADADYTILVVVW